MTTGYREPQTRSHTDNDVSVKHQVQSAVRRSAVVSDFRPDWLMKTKATPAATTAYPDSSSSVSGRDPDIETSSLWSTGLEKATQRGRLTPQSFRTFATSRSLPGDDRAACRSRSDGSREPARAKGVRHGAAA